MPRTDPQTAPDGGEAKPVPAQPAQAGTTSAETAPSAEGGNVTSFRVSLPSARPGEPPFEGPLDLLLHLVREHQMDIFDIPIARITESYLATLEVLRELDIDVAGEFIHMAAQLMLIKSKLLLPRTEVAEDAQPEDTSGIDPRAELVRRLLEYQKYRAAGEDLGNQDILERDVFVRRARVLALPQVEGPEGLADISVFKLIEALDRALRNARPEVSHEVLTDRLSISDAISRVAEILKDQRRASFYELLAGPEEQRNRKTDIIAVFLALLEMAKLKLIRIFQVSAEESGPGAEIMVEATVTLGDGITQAEVDYR